MVVVVVAVHRGAVLTVQVVDDDVLLGVKSALGRGMLAARFLAAASIFLVVNLDRLALGRGRRARRRGWLQRQVQRTRGRGSPEELMVVLLVLMFLAQGRGRVPGEYALLAESLSRRVRLVEMMLMLLLHVAERMLGDLVDAEVRRESVTHRRGR